MEPRAAELIRSLQLVPHPEGGFYRRVFESAQRLPGGRACASAILFLLPAGVVGRWHRLDVEELWHFYEGAPLQLWIAEASQSLRSELLGPVGVDCLPQRAVPAQSWQASRSCGGFTLVGCTLSPAFEFAGFTLLAEDDQARRAWPHLERLHPEFL
ncbi:MAG: cupin domain-containing protein [Pseudomonas sp.]|uniref:cupin domain-containing protein n=1 Tax=Pseudomonas sp. TaxID=306 RepID=UPI0033943801